MKKLSLLLILSVFFSIAFFAQEKYSAKYGKVLESNNHSYLTEESVGSEIKVTGLLTAKKNVFALEENPESRSVVTFGLEVKKWGLKRKLRKFDGQKVTLVGVVTEASSTWTKKIKVLSIE